LVDKDNFNIFATIYDKVKVMKAKKCFKSGTKEVFEIELLNGQKIEATGSHKFLTKDGWVRLDELKKSPIAFPVNYGDHESDIPDSEVELIGHFLSNGCMLKSRAITYTCNVLDTEVSDAVMKIASEATNDGINPYFKDSCVNDRRWRTIFFPSKIHNTHGKTSPMADIFRKYGVWDKRTKEKFIPDQLFYLSHKKTAILLRALFTGDGTVYYSKKGNREGLKISYSSASDDLILDIQQLLAKLGIVSFISKLENKKGQKWNNLYLAGKSNVKLFVEKVGFLNGRKNDILVNGWEKVKDRKAGWNKYSFNNERTLCYMPIKNITNKGVQDVYDIEVPDLHNFVANNMIVHNSLEQDTDVVMFMYRPAYYKIKEDPTGKFTPEEMAVLCELEFAKHRNGALVTIPLRFTKSAMVFSDFYDQSTVIETEADLNENPELEF
jgi:replicative DNA helicase